MNDPSFTFERSLTDGNSMLFGYLIARESVQQFICRYNFDSLKTTVFTPGFHFLTLTK